MWHQLGIINFRTNKVLNKCEDKEDNAEVTHTTKVDFNFQLSTKYELNLELWTIKLFNKNVS